MKKAFKVIKRMAKWYFEKSAESYCYPTGTFPISSDK
jgi:hypothetical protein